MGMKTVGLGLVALACVFGTACSSSDEKSGDAVSTTTSSTTVPGATTPATVDPSLGPDPCQALTIAQLEDVFGAGVSDGVRTPENPGWCTWTITGGAQLTFKYPGKGNAYKAKTPNAVQAVSTKRATAGTTKDATVGDAAYFLPLDSNLVVAKAPDIYFELHFEAGVPTNDAQLQEQLTALAQKHLEEAPA